MKEIKGMEWVVLFIVSWVIFILTGKWREFRTNAWAGVLAVCLQLAVDSNAMKHELYRVHYGVVEIMGSSLFFVLGPVFVIGMLISQNHPYKKGKALLNVLVLAILYTVQELLLLSRGVLEYTNWDLIDSAVVNLAAMIIISWFSVVVLGRMGSGAH
jgi:hypothetical protein